MGENLSHPGLRGHHTQGHSVQGFGIRVLPPRCLLLQRSSICVLTKFLSCSYQPEVMFARVLETIYEDCFFISGFWVLWSSLVLELPPGFFVRATRPPHRLRMRGLPRKP